MSFIFIDGVDHYDASADMADKWDTVDIGSILTTGGRFGGGAVRMLNNDDLGKDFTAVTEVIVGFAIKIDQLPGNDGLIIRFRNSTNIFGGIYITPGGGLKAKVSTGSEFSPIQIGGEGTIHEGVWHTIEARWLVNDTTGQVEGKIDGVQSFNGSNLDTKPSTPTDIDNIQLFALTFGETHFDDFYILDTSGSAPQNTFLDHWKVDTLYPDGDGNYVEFDTTNGSGTHSLNVDDNPPDDDTTYNETATANDRDTFTMDNLAAITSQTIFAVQQVSRAKGISGSSTFQNMLRISGTDYNSGNISTTQDVYEYHLTLWDDDPNAGPGAWAEGVINGMESGVEHITSNTTRITQHCLEVIRQNSAPLLRVSQIGAQVIRSADAPDLRVSQLGVQVLRSNLAPPNARISQVVLEVAREEPLSVAQLTQVSLEVAQRNIPGQQQGLQSWMVFDDKHTLDILMISGIAPTSAVDDLAVLNGENVALLGNEILQFRDVQDLGNNQYRLSRLLRGRLGTELFMNSHSIGETFVILDEDSVRRVIQATDDINVQRFFKIVGAGIPIVAAPITPVVNTGASQKPWKPARVRGTRDGSDNLTITWFRRTRIDGGWRDYTDVPLGESDERYEVDILNSAGTVVRTIEVTEETASYTAAEQTTDFGGVQDPVAVIVYQLSRVVGRGYGAKAIV